MNKTLLSKLFVLFALLFTGVGTAWADEVYYTLDGTTTGGNNNYASESEITQGSMTWMVTGNTTMSPWRIGGKSLTNQDRPVYSTTGTSEETSQIDVTLGTKTLTLNSLTLIVASDAAFSSVIDTKTISTPDVSTTHTFTPSTGVTWSAGSYIKLVFNVTAGSSNQYVQLTKVELYKALDTSTCATPTFDPAAGTYTSAQSVTISTTTEGATIYYTTNGDDPVVSGDVYSGPITVSTSQTIKAIASAAGYESSSIATAVYNIVNLEHAGTEADPYTVADAINAIDANAGITGVYVTGIVSEIVTAYSASYGNISYNISADGSTTSAQLQAFRGKSYNGDNFTSEDDIQVGDEVVVYGNLTLYNNTTYEFAANNQLVSLNRPSSTVDTPVLTPSATSAETGSDVTITVSQTDFDGDAGEIWYTTDGTDPKTSSTKQVLDDSTINTITVTMADADIVVKAVATTDGGTTFSNEASVTISLIKVYTIKSINEVCDPSVTTSTDIATHVRLQFTDAVVVDKIPGSSNNNLYIREGSWAICLFAHTSEQIVGTTLQVGDKLNGWIEGTVCNYRGLPEFKTTSATTIDNLTYESGQTVIPTDCGTDYSYIESFNNRADLISMEGTITKDGTRYYFDTDGIQLYEPSVFATNLLGTLEDDADWASYTFRVTGPVAAIYSGKPEIYVRKVEIKLDTTEDSHENVSRMSMYYGNYNLVPGVGQWIETYNVNSGSKTLTRNAWYNHTGETAAIAKGTGFLTWTSASQTYWQIVEDSYTNFHEADANNILTGTDYIQGITTDPNYYYFVLSYYDSTDKEGTLGFYFPAGTGETQLAGETSVFENGAHKAYAVVPVADVPANVIGFAFGGGAVTGINDINIDTENSQKQGVYTISGVRVQNTQNLPKGIYVMNGKKVVVK